MLKIKFYFFFLQKFVQYIVRNIQKLKHIILYKIFFVVKGLKEDFFRILKLTLSPVSTFTVLLYLLLKILSTTKKKFPFYFNVTYLRCSVFLQKYYIGRLCKRLWMKKFQQNSIFRGPKWKRDKLETGLITVGANSSLVVKGKRGQQANGPWKP